MLADFSITRLSNDMKITVQKKYLRGQIFGLDTLVNFIVGFFTKKFKIQVAVYEFIILTLRVPNTFSRSRSRVHISVSNRSHSNNGPPNRIWN